MKENMFPYGSSNQVDSLDKHKTGASALPRVMIAQGFSSFLKNAIKVKQTEEVQLDSTALAAQYYGAGNCGENSTGTYAWLSAFLPPGYTVSQVTAHPSFKTHAYTLLWWKDKDAAGEKHWCRDPVVVDPEFSSQASLFSHSDNNPAHYQNNVSPAVAKNPYTIHRSYTVPDNEKEAFYASSKKGPYKDIGDHLGVAASTLPADVMRLFPSRESIADIPPGKLEKYKKEGTINHLFSEFHANFSYLNKYFKEKRSDISSDYLGYKFSEDFFTIYSDRSLLGPHLGKFIDYEYKEKVHDSSGALVEKIHRLSDFGADPSKKWTGTIIDGERQIWSATLPPALLPDPQTEGSILLDPEERFRGKAGYRLRRAVGSAAVPPSDSGIQYPQMRKRKFGTLRDQATERGPR